MRTSNIITLVTCLAAIAIGPGCQKSKDKMKEAEAEHAKKAYAAVGEVLQAYADSLTSTIDDYAIEEAPSAEYAPMLVWRKKAAAKHIQDVAEETASKMGDGPWRRELRQGANVFTTFRDFWIGQPIPGEEVVVVKVGESADEPWSGEGRVIVELPEYLALLDELSRVDATRPWQVAIDFERILPKVLEVHTFRGKGGLSAWRFAELLTEANRFDGDRWSGDDSAYVAYREELCKEGLKAACGVLWEQRDRVVAQRYVGYARELLARFRKQYPHNPLDPVAQRLAADLDAEEARVALDPEYPVLPGTRIAWSSDSNVQATVELGPRGAVMHLHTEPTKQVLPLLGSTLVQRLSAAAAAKLAGAFKDARERLYAATPDTYSGRRIHIRADRRVPMETLLGTLTEAAHAADVRAFVLVARDRAGGTLKLREMDLNILPAEQRQPVQLSGPGGRWTCKPTWTAGDHVDPVGVHLFVEGEQLTLRTVPPLPVEAPTDPLDPTAAPESQPEAPPAEPKAEATAAPPAPERPEVRTAQGRAGEKPDAARLVELLDQEPGPLLIALGFDVDYGSFHQLLDLVGLECPGEDCVEPSFRANLRIALCDAKVTPEPPPAPFGTPSSAPAPAPAPAPEK